MRSMSAATGTSTHSEEEIMGDDLTVQPTQGPSQPMVAAGGEYSFDQIQKNFFAESAGTMRFAGMAALAFGVLQLIGGTVCILAGTLPGAICIGFSGVLTLRSEERRVGK